jgi:hypothetical protein
MSLRLRTSVCALLTCSLALLLASASAQAQLTLNETDKLLASDGAANDYFGWSVAITGDTAVIGAWGDADSGYGTGSAYVFRYDGASWVQQAKLLASDGEANDWFGISVSISGDTALIGADGDTNERALGRLGIRLPVRRFELGPGGQADGLRWRTKCLVRPFRLHQ